MKKVLIFFGSRGYEKVKRRLCKSAVKYFDEIIAYSEEDIDKEFYISNIKIFQHWRGWGYWLWKPYFIAKTLERLKDNDLCFYLDATGEFLSSPEILMNNCISNNGILLFENSSFINFHWTKMDCFNLMGLTEEKYVHGYQADAAVQIYQKNQWNTAFVQEMLAYSKNYHILTDAPNITGLNLPGFKDHRHDQSILSLLAIKYQVPLVRSPRQVGSYPDSTESRIIALNRDVNKERAFYKLLLKKERR